MLRGARKRPRVRLHAGAPAPPSCSLRRAAVAGCNLSPVTCPLPSPYSTRSELICTSQMMVCPIPAVNGVENSSCPPVVRAISR